VKPLTALFSIFGEKQSGENPQANDNDTEWPLREMAAAGWRSPAPSLPHGKQDLTRRGSEL
jgi:hypothetical protein